MENEYSLLYLKMLINENVSLKYYYYNNTKKILMRAWYLIIKDPNTNRKSYIVLSKHNNKIINDLQKYLGITKIYHTNTEREESVVIESIREKDNYYNKLVKLILENDNTFYSDMFYGKIKPKYKNKCNIDVY